MGQNSQCVKAERALTLERFDTLSTVNGFSIHKELAKDMSVHCVHDRSLLVQCAP